MDRILGSYTPFIYAVFRFVMGFLFFWHGTQKMLGFPASGRPSEPLNAISGTAGTIELVGGFMIMVGLFAGIAAFISSGLMAVAYFMAHFKVEKFLPIQNGGEPAVLYCFVFLFIAAYGSGILSVDSLIFKNRKMT